MTTRRQLVVLGSVLALLGVPVAAAEQDDASAIREILLARFAKLHNIIVRFTTTAHLTLLPGMRLEDAFVKSDKGATVVDVGTRVDKEEFSVLDNMVSWGRRELSFNSEIRDPAFYQLPRVNHEMDIIVPGRAEWFFGAKSNAETEYVGQIQNSKAMTSDLIPTVLGLGACGERRLLTEEDIRNMKITRSADGKILLQHLRPGGYVHEWTVDPNRGYAITAHRSGPGGNFADIWTMEDFRDVGGIQLPHKIHRTHWWDDGSKGPEWIMDVNEYRLDDPANTPERYKMRWPEGTRVTDMRSGMSFVAQGDNLTYDDDRIAQETIEALDMGALDEVESSTEPPAADANGVGLVAQAGDVDANEVAPLPGPAVSPGSRQWLWAVAVLVVLGLAAVFHHHVRHLGR
jgi:hypothetical protein